MADNKIRNFGSLFLEKNMAYINTINAQTKALLEPDKYIKYNKAIKNSPVIILFFALSEYIKKKKKRPNRSIPVRFEFVMPKTRNPLL